MTEIRPFQAIHYNFDKIGDVSKVVCPPYDVISPQRQDDFHKQSEYNFIRIILGKDLPEDDTRSNKYTRARELYEKWLKEGVLVQDERPAIYFYQQEYKVVGERHRRFGFITLMRLQDDDAKSKIFPHENTHSKAKEDRFKLWKTLSSNLSPIFVCFSDREKHVQKIFQQHVAPCPPLCDLTDDEEVRHLLWKLDDPDLVNEIVATMNERELFIADGHHRYEVAREYRRFRRSKLTAPGDQEPFNYVMTYFTNMDSRDLRIFPMHRVVKNFSADLKMLEEFFRIDKIRAREDLVILLAKAGKNEHAFGLYTKEGVKLLRLKNKLLIDKHIKEGSKEFRHLDATILKHFVFDRVGVQSEDIIYTHDMFGAINVVDQGQAEACFIMNPVKIQQLKKVALNGERMPPKTTYFYPKVLSGLTVYKID